MTDRQTIAAQTYGLTFAKRALNDDTFADAPSITVHLHDDVANTLLAERGWTIEPIDGGGNAYVLPGHTLRADGGQYGTDYLWDRQEALTLALTAEAFAAAGTPEERIARTEAKIAANGYSLRYVDYCEDADTPGLLGQIRGAVNHDRREVKVGRKANPTPEALAEALDHELHHIISPDWDCGSRDVLGRGGATR